jgi:hypothetical protein
LQDARIAARHRRNRFLVRATLMTLGSAGVVALVIGGLVAVTPRFRGTEAAAPSPARPAPDSAPAAQPTVAPREVVLSGEATPRSAAKANGPSPIVAEGRTELGDSVYAERQGADVVVHFDTDLLRTRQDEKFERVVRQTLPKVYGADVAARLDSVSPGAFVRGGDLLTDLPSRGIALALPASGRTLMLYPLTRPGRDGPLVVAYRASIATSPE